MKFNSQSTQMLKDKIEKKINYKKGPKKPESTSLTRKTRDPDYETKITLFQVN